MSPCRVLAQQKLFAIAAKALSQGISIA